MTNADRRRWVTGCFAVCAATGFALVATPRARTAPPAPPPPTTASTAATRPVVEKYDDGSPRARYATDAKGLKTGGYEELFPGGAVRLRGAYADGLKDGL